MTAWSRSFPGRVVVGGGRRWVTARSKGGVGVVAAVTHHFAPSAVASTIGSADGMGPLHGPVRVLSTVSRDWR